MKNSGNFGGRELVMAGCMALDGTAAAVERAPAPLERLPRELREDALRLWEAQKKI